MYFFLELLQFQTRYKMLDLTSNLRKALEDWDVVWAEMEINKEESR